MAIDYLLMEDLVKVFLKAVNPLSEYYNNSIYDRQIDIDECSETSSSCSQVCINTEGSFICECHTGFELGNDNWTCTMGKYQLLIVIVLHGM